jgi:hypothetical protein
LGKVGRLSRILGRGSWIFAAKLIVSLVAIVFAATISVTSSTHQAEIGSALSVTNGLVAMDKGFSVSIAGSAATSCSSPVTFGAIPGTANTLITGGHLVYDVQVNSTTSATPNKNFTATLVLASNTYGPVCIQTPASPANLQTIDCKFDVGTTLPASPYTFKVTVQ